MPAVTPLNQANNTRNFVPADENWEIKLYPFKASTAIVDGAVVAPEIVTNDVTGNLTLAPAEPTTGRYFVGILAEPIATTDSDYATAGKLKKVWVPKTQGAEAYASIGAGTFTVADVGRTVELHSDSKSIACDTKGLAVIITGFVSSAKARVRLFIAPLTETA